MGCSNSKTRPTKTNVKVKQQNKSAEESVFKLLVIGDSGVGKSSLLVRFSDGTFSDSFISTIGVDYKIKTMNADGKEIKLQIWDTAGQERFKTITSSYYRAAHGIILVYDITNLDSFKNIRKWVNEINRYTSDSVQKLLVGNKCDLVNDRKVTHELGSSLSTELGIQFIETSAKDDTNVERAFENIARNIVQVEQAKD